MTTRDRSILGALAIFGLLAAFWFVGVGPKRDELSKLDEKQSQTEQAVTATRQEAEQFARDRLEFPSAYTTMVRLGKAVPTGADVPSLVVQLEHAATEAGVDFRQVKLDSGSDASSSTASTPPPPAPAAGGANGGATGPSGSQTAPSGSGSSPESAGSDASSTAGGSSPATSSTASTATAPADATTAATLPIGTAMGPAQLPMFKLNMVFEGNFFKMADLVHNIRALVKRQDRQLLVSGRLLTVDGVAFSEGPSGFPQVETSVVTTAYLLPSTQGLLAGATPQGPAGASAGTTAPASTPGGGSAPPAAVVTR